MNFYHIALLSTLSLLLSCNQSNDSLSQQAKESVDWQLTGFVKVDSINPIMIPSDDQLFDCPVRKEKVQWEARNVLNPSAIVKDGKVFMIYRAQDQNMTSRLGLAVSEDGLHFDKLPEPILYPDNDDMYGLEWPGGVEDPRIVESEDGRYILTYTSYDGKVARLCLASSSDLMNWEKHGPVLADERYQDTWSKAGAIISRIEDSKVIATKINGQYWMYFGDTQLFMATSEDLINWKVMEDPQLDQMISVLHPRRGYFDSRLVESGPFALIRDQGVLLIYNSMNAAVYNDPDLPVGTYAAGQALFDAKRPYRIIDRSEGYFIHPDKEYERVGEVNEVCFVEGLVNFKGKWFLYYGTADSRIAVAVLGQ